MRVINTYQPAYVPAGFDIQSTYVYNITKLIIWKHYVN